MSDVNGASQAPGPRDPHEEDDAGHGHAGHEDPGGHGHAAALGPIDWRAWAAGILGAGAGLAVAACLYITTAMA